MFFYILDSMISFILILHVFFFFFNDTATTEIYTLPLHDSLFFFNDTATTEIYTLSLHDALPIFQGSVELAVVQLVFPARYHHGGHGIAHEVGQRAALAHEAVHAQDQGHAGRGPLHEDRKSTRLNSSH